MTSFGDEMGAVTALLDRRLRVLRALCLALVGSVVLMAAVSVGVVQFGSFALLESIGLLGLVVAVLTGMLRHALVLCLVAVIAMLVRWPRRGAVEALLRRRGMA